MFGIDSGELLVVAVVALVVIGPKDLPRVMRTVGQWVGRARGVARHFRSGIDTMIREAELEEMEQKWKEENERILAAHPATTLDTDRPALPATEPALPEPQPMLPLDSSQPGAADNPPPQP